MNFYPHNIGDFAVATQYLDDASVGLFVRLLDRYMSTEKPIKTDWVSLAFQGERFEKANGLLKALFEETEEGWIYAPMADVIADYQAKAERNRVNGRKGGRPRKIQNPTETQMVSGGFLNETQKNLNQEPITNNQEPEVVVGEIAPMPAQPDMRAAVAASPSAASPASLFPEEVSEPAPKSTSKYFPCPYEQIVRLYHEKLPMLPAIQTLTTQRKAAIKARWNQVIKEEHCQTPEEVLELFSFFFDRVAGNKFLTGGIDPSPGHSKPFRAGLDWLMKESNFVKIAENYYAR